MFVKPSSKRFESQSLGMDLLLFIILPYSIDSSFMLAFANLDLFEYFLTSFSGQTPLSCKTLFILKFPVPNYEHFLPPDMRSDLYRMDTGRAPRSQALYTGIGSAFNVVQSSSQWSRDIVIHSMRWLLVYQVVTCG